MSRDRPAYRLKGSGAALEASSLDFSFANQILDFLAFPPDHGACISYGIEAFECFIRRGEAARRRGVATRGLGGAADKSDDLKNAVFQIFRSQIIENTRNRQEKICKNLASQNKIVMISEIDA
jgi:hypothetical protein